MLMFIHGLKYVMPCQSRFSRQSIDERVTEQFESISTTDDRAKQAFSALKDLLYKLHSKPPSKNLVRCVRRELKILRSMQDLLHHRPDIVIRRMDKCKVFYIGKADDFAQKTEEYMSKTEAYEEIRTGQCPLADIVLAVQTLLNYLFSKNALTKKQCQNLTP